MRYEVVLLLLACLFACAGVTTADAAKKSSDAKKNAQASESSAKEMNVVGYLTPSNDGKTFIIKVSGGDKSTLLYLPEDKSRYEEFVGLEVRAKLLRKGADIVAVRSIDAVNKEAYDARQAARREAARQAAEAKKKQQQKK